MTEKHVFTEDNASLPLFRMVQGSLPILISAPHAGAYLPPEIEARMSDVGKSVQDTDWHVDQLWQFAAGDEGMGAHLLAATHARYVIDLNRDPDGQPLYPGQFNSGLCPLESFDGQALYLPGKEPDETEVQQRLQIYWQPYHQKLQQYLQQLRQQHGRVLLLEAHSIRSEVPALFEGELPALNLGTHDGTTLPRELADELMAVAEKSCFSAVLNARFKGGYITRHYAAPPNNIYTLQIEIAQKHYMDEHLPFTFRELRAARLQKTLGDMLNVLIGWVRAG